MGSPGSPTASVRNYLIRKSAAMRLDISRNDVDVLS